MAYTDYPPYLYTENGKITGLYRDIVTDIFDAIGQPYSIETLPFKRALVQTEVGDGLVIGILKTDEREEVLDFSDPFYQERIVVLSSNNLNKKLTTVQQLKGMRIGTLWGWSYGAEFDRLRTSDLFSARDGELASNFYMLAKGRLDAVIHTDLSAGYMLNELSLEQKIFVVSEPLVLGNIYIATKKGTHTELLKRFNAQLKAVEQQQKIKQLIEMYTQ
ncbi:ABC transporter substrate-binding protein [Reinekea sp. G2M2-21]|uniref:substrate-binding periplasmic protein n=1 Tax=Reinekea sp. G2M2-21 TaxID=2788942 RepID=UPI0018A924C7|nr:transporter substrate-binding domain-containing protein [Reinekea sp. G2M2-21]